MFDVVVDAARVIKLPWSSNQHQFVLQLQHSVHPTVTDILEVKPLFENHPYSLERLNVAYVVSFVGVVQTPGSTFRNKKNVSALKGCVLRG